MRTLSLLFFICAGWSRLCAQRDAQPLIFAHNDYVGAEPFHAAYRLQVGYIEADVFLQHGSLLVAHTRLEIDKNKTLERLYLQPLQRAIDENGGRAYPDRGKHLTMMIDLKTAGMSTLDALVALLGRYAAITSANNVHILISGDVPDPALWEKYPAYITFDGRPGKNYTDAQWQRIGLVSTNFKEHVRWDGKGPLPAEAAARMSTLINAAHARNKKFRFWATPDFPQAWQALTDAGMDMIVTDKVQSLHDFFAAR